MLVEHVLVKGKKYFVSMTGLLDLSKKKIESMDEIEGLADLKTLRELNLDSNKIKDIKRLENQIPLKILSFAGNQVTHIQNLDMLVNLEKLDLSSNQIAEIQGLDHLASLKELLLNGNIITAIKGMETLVNLEILNLDYNRIKKIEGLENQKSIEKFFIKGNQIPEEIVEELGGFHKNGYFNEPVMVIQYCQQQKLQIKKEQEAIEKLQKMMAVSNRVTMDMMKHALDLDEATFNEKIWDWANKFGLKIDGDYVILRDSTSKVSTSEEISMNPESDIISQGVPEEGVKIARGGEFTGGKFVYKVKVQNNSASNITDVTVVLVSYPKDCIDLITDMARMVSKIESGGFRSLEFELEPHKDCVQGIIHASVTYIDQNNKSHTSVVQPFEVRYICDLLKPFNINEDEFDDNFLKWETTGEYVKIHKNVYDLFERSERTLSLNNFYIVSSRLNEVEGNDQVIGVIKAFAKGMYASKKIGLLVEISGKIKGELSRIKITSTSEDGAMVGPPILEFLETFNQSGTSFDKMTDEEQAAFIKEKSLLSLKCLLIINKSDGLTLYSKNFSESKVDPLLISGFLTAIGSFGSELLGGQHAGIKKMEYENLKIILQDGEKVIVALILEDVPEVWLSSKLSEFTRAFEESFKDPLDHWMGNVVPFESSDALVNQIFEIAGD